ncbi:DUF2071 domain-containing protein [bacterium SCSIO 12741]|nr:DUF2071 domain-containing protein [bacterium SCSIO 12741]
MKNNQLFMRCRWENLILLNYPCDPNLLKPYIPGGIELDYFQGKTYLSLVAFTFRDLRVLGFKVPFHQYFPELNLRCYVKRYENGEWRRGVVFIKELVPKVMIEWAARNLFKERFGHVQIRERAKRGEKEASVYYSIREGNFKHGISALTQAKAEDTAPHTLEEFISQRYYAYNGNQRVTHEYRVEHVPWKIYPDKQIAADIHPIRLFPKAFDTIWDKRPENAFMLDGSPVDVRYIQALKN